MASFNCADSVDDQRFLNDAEYRKESILGFALSLEDASYATSLRLALKFDVDEWEVYWTHLSFLLTESGLDVPALQTSIRKRRLIEGLISHGLIVCQRLSTDVYPALDGCSFHMMMLYYTVVEKLSNDDFTIKQCQKHKKMLQYLNKYAPKINYKYLISENQDALDVVTPFLNASNFSTFAKILVQIPNKSVTLEHILGVWARKVFFELAPKAGHHQAFEKCTQTLTKLDHANFLSFVNGIVFSDQAKSLYEDDLSRYFTLKLCIDYACSDNNSKLNVAGRELNALYKAMMMSEVLLKKDRRTSKARAYCDDKVTDLEKFIALARNALKDGEIEEAQSILLHAFNVPALMATRQTAMFFVEKIRLSLQDSAVD